MQGCCKLIYPRALKLTSLSEAELAELKRQIQAEKKAGWIKIENRQRMPSEKLLAALTAFLVAEKIIRANQQEALLNELCTLKYTADRKPFLAQLAKDRLATLTPVAILPREFAIRRTE